MRSVVFSNSTMPSTDATVNWHNLGVAIQSELAQPQSHRLPHTYHSIATKTIQQKLPTNSNK